MVADVVDLEPVSPCIFGKCRVILPKCRERPRRARVKVAGSQELDRISSLVAEQGEYDSLAGNVGSPTKGRVIRGEISLADDGIRELLRLAGVRPSDGEAAAWLSGAIKALRRDDKAVVERPLPADHNALLTDIEKFAKTLIERLERLRRYPFSQHTFWRSSAFGPVYYDRVEMREVFSTLETIVLAADMAKDRRRGRRRKARKQHVVNLAFGFFVRFSPHTPSGTPTGAFASFAREFYSAATGSDPEQDGGLDRQIRQALTRLPIELKRARRKSQKKSRVSS
jgi:hypothetical protein